MFGLANGVPAAVGSCGAEKDVGEVDPAGAAGVAGIEVDAGRSNCTVDDGVGGWRKMEVVAGVGDAAAADNLNLDGDRERDRRSDRTAEPTSTWWTWVGEGSVSVPPLPFEYDIVAPFHSPKSSPAHDHNSQPLN